jgi:alkaline phosphatase D
MKENRIRNTVWVTADVHYATSIHYDPQRASFKEFDSFWEFVSGPMHAGTFGPGALDGTFGPVAQFVSVPKGMKGNRPPSEGLQFFGMVRIDGMSRVMSVTQHDASGRKLHEVNLDPVG